MSGTHQKTNVNMAPLKKIKILACVKQDANIRARNRGVFKLRGTEGEKAMAGVCLNTIKQR